jgi:hypothetical protein
MADVVIYTANFGGYDQTREQVAQDVDVDWLYLTDGQKGPDRPDEWDVRVVAPTEEHPNLAAKVYKAQPPWEMGEWKLAVWIDANMQITDPSFVRQATSYLNDGVAFWAHPRRDCVYEEARVCIPGGPEAQNGRYRNLPIARQMDAYSAEGFPEHWGLFATGTTIWTRKASERLGAAWLAECRRWGFQDQLALPVVCWRLGIEPGVFGLHQIERRWSTGPVSARRLAQGEPYYLANRWLRIWPHFREPYV